MSNQLVGEIYQRIIEEVIETSVIDFEEAGVNASTLQELKQVWQSKLSDLRVARFPWDPPEVAQPAAPAPTLASPVKTQPHQQSQPAIKQESNVQNPNPPQTQNAGQVRIKSEPGTEPQGIYTAGNPTFNPHLAEMRARQNLAQKFGSRPTGGLVLPGLSSNQPQQRQNGHQQNGIPQHDGVDDGDDLETEGVPIGGYGSISRGEADRILLRRIGAAERESAKATEELFKALELNTTSPSQSSSPSKGDKKRHRRIRQDAYDAALDFSTSYPLASRPSTSPALPGVSQLDGESGDEEVDEDAINSDLDDPEDDEIDNEDDDEVPQIMLCMYDKVQRTKNKWKCVLKDGVLTINGKEYVFHKANGEYEW